MFLWFTHFMLHACSSFKLDTHVKSRFMTHTCSHVKFLIESSVVLSLCPIRSAAMDAAALLALIGEGPAADTQPLARSSARSRSAADAQPLARSNPRGRAVRGRQDRREEERLKRQLGDLQRKMQKFNSSGNAVTLDDLMLVPIRPAGRRGRKSANARHGRPPARSAALGVKVKAKAGQWKRWLPDAVRKAASSTGSVRGVATGMGFGDRPQGQVQASRLTAASCILNTQEAGLRRLCQTSQTMPLSFFITNHVFDETKLWYRIGPHGHRHWSTLAHHTQATWKESGGCIHDADIFRVPKAMVRYTAACQWNILDEDTTSGVRGPIGAPCVV